MGGRSSRLPELAGMLGLASGFEDDGLWEGNDGDLMTVGNCAGITGDSDSEVDEPDVGSAWSVPSANGSVGDGLWTLGMLGPGASGFCSGGPRGPWARFNLNLEIFALDVEASTPSGTRIADEEDASVSPVSRDGGKASAKLEDEVTECKVGPALYTSPFFKSSNTALAFSSSGSLALSPVSPPIRLLFSNRPIRIARRIDW